MKLPSPAITIAMIALIVALAGSATAGVISFAQRAGVADNARKLQGKTATQVAALAKNRISLQTATFSIAAGQVLPFRMSCPGSTRVIGGAWRQNPPSQSVVDAGNGPGDDNGRSWLFTLANPGTTGAHVVLYALCLG
jgi:hypothetical protein